MIREEIIQFALECAFLSLSFFCSSSRFCCVFPQSRRHKNSSFTTREKRKALVAAVKARVCFGQRPPQSRRRRLLGPNKVVVFFFSMRRKISKANAHFFVLSNAKKMFTTQKKRTHKTHIMFRVLIPFCLSFFLSFAKKKQIPFLHGARARRHKTHTR